MSGFIDDTITAWTPYYEQMLTKDDAAEIVENWGAFINVLADWKAMKERAKKND